MSLLSTVFANLIRTAPSWAGMRVSAFRGPSSAGIDRVLHVLK